MAPGHGAPVEILLVEDNFRDVQLTVWTPQQAKIHNQATEWFSLEIVKLP